MGDHAAGGTVLIVEPHLEGRFGHPWRYAHALVDRLAAAGWSVRILAHAVYDGPARIGDAPVAPVFSRSYYELRDRDAGRGGGLWRRRDPSRARSTLSPFAAIVRDALACERRRSRDVRLLVPTATPAILAELSALPLLLDGELPPTALLFHEEPELYAHWYRPLRLDALPARLRGSGWGDALHCFATNAPLARRLADVLGAPVDDIGDVFGTSEIDRLRAVAARPANGEAESGGPGVVGRLAALKRSGRHIAWCPGSMRPDKGQGRLPAIVQALDADPRFHLVVQAPTGTTGRSAEVDALDGHPRVTVIRELLTDTAYDALLGLADVLLLPYDAAVFGRRVSRVFLEASLACRPVVASAGIAAQAEEEGEGSLAVFVDDWTSWPARAAVLLDGSRRGGASVDGTRDGVAARLTRWHAMTDRLTAERAPRAAPRPVLYVRSAQLSEHAAALCRRHLAQLAARGVPVLELVVAASGRGRRALRDEMVERLADSAAQLSAWTRRRRGAAGVAERLVVIATSALARGLSIRHGRSRKPVPLDPLVRTLQARRRFAGIVVLQDDADAPFLVHASGVSVQTMSSGAGGESAEPALATIQDERSTMSAPTP
ncbi:MAG: hypothetical protein HXX10_13235 [Rhodoplanes sp.]|uniref:hypothetical protein n=1 Tax=Rhodoplanes sp. TaxID=1968906 RepID=UPI001794899A|nr:hypothetical protein [Rhodoplanes sp.]NVO14993.1 hypothetical protein [Rhodoplanes sp.]